MAEFVSKIDEVSTKIDATDSITALSDSYKILCTQIGLKAQDKVASIQQAWRVRGSLRVEMPFARLRTTKYKLRPIDANHPLLSKISRNF
jgi:hypothetical protein